MVLLESTVYLNGGSTLAFWAYSVCCSVTQFVKRQGFMFIGSHTTIDLNEIIRKGIIGPILV